MRTFGSTFGANVDVNNIIVVVLNEQELVDAILTEDGQYFLIDEEGNNYLQL